MESRANGVKSIYVYKRESNSDDFDAIYYLDNDLINDPLNRNHQPTISNNGEYFAFVRGTEDLWTANDLYIARYNISAIDDDNIELQNKTITAYPNPAVDFITFDISNVQESDVTLSIYSLYGNQIKTIAEFNS